MNGFTPMRLSCRKRKPRGQVAEIFAEHQALGSEGFVFDHRDMLRLAYVNSDCRSRVLAQLAELGSLGAFAS